ncbi:MAG: hypothetical protein RL357_1280 [Pseudomonadota bacterium]
MLRWFFFMALALMLFQAAWPWLSRLGLGRMPLDFRFHWLGREWSVPLGSTLILTGLMMLLERVFWHWI